MIEMVIVFVVLTFLGLVTAGYYYTAPVGWRPTPKEDRINRGPVRGQPVAPPVTPALPACGHTMATPVMHDEPPSPELILVAFWCPDCETQLPPSFIPPPPGHELVEERTLREAASLLTEADKHLHALAKRNKQLERIFDESHAPGGPWDQLAHARKLLRQQRDEIIDLRKGRPALRWRCGHCRGVVSDTVEHVEKHHPNSGRVSFRLLD